MQTMAVQLGGKVIPGDKREFGYAEVEIPETSILLRDIEDRVEQGRTLLDVWMSHGDQVSELPGKFKIIACTDNCAITGMADEQRKFYGLQFHPEVSHTRQGLRILERFIIDICQSPSGQPKILLMNKLN